MSAILAARARAHAAAIPKDVADDLQRGRLEESCPACGRWEAAGSYCTGCARPMGPADWYPNGDMARRDVGRQAAPTDYSAALLARFWAKVDKATTPDGCWPWTAGRSRDGYGAIGSGGVGGRPLRAHRISFEIHHGPIPAGMYVCHTCDNPPCVNPAHLFVGTNRDNQLDAVRKGRIATKRPTDVRDVNAKRAPAKRGRGRPRRVIAFDGTLGLL